MPLQETAQHATKTSKTDGGEVLLTVIKVNKHIQNGPKTWKEVEETHPPQELLLDKLDSDGIKIYSESHKICTSYIA